MDIFEEASELEDKHRNLAIKAIRDRVANPQKFTGYCLYCNSELTINSRFCKGEDCGERWEFDQKMSRIDRKRR